MADRAAPECIHALAVGDMLAAMARIRIVDAWLRSPAAGVNNQRSVMVVAEKWAEQRVLMRAFANSVDQTRPTIFLHGTQLAIGPAGVDSSGSWGIHVEPPIDGRAQELRAQLELAARRLAGSKGNAPRLVDEAPAFDGKATQHWAPGTAPDLPGRSGQPDAGAYYEPSESMPGAQALGGDLPVASYPAAGDPGPPPPAPPLKSPTRLGPPPATPPGPPPAAPPRTPGYSYEHSQSHDPGQGQGHGWSSPLASSPPLRDRREARRTAHKTERGYAVGPSAPIPPRRNHSAPGAHFSGLITKTMPPGFQLSTAEREILNALDTQPYLTVSQVEHLTHAADAIVWMHAFIQKLAHFGLDVIAYGAYIRGQPTYRLSTARTR